MPKACINNLSIYYEIYGEGEPLVLLSGLGTEIPTCWGPVTPLLSKRYKILMFDFPGSGKSSLGKNLFSLERMAQCTIDLCNYLGFEHPYILGISMGSIVAQIIGAKYGDQVKKLVLSNTFTKQNAKASLVFHAFLHLLKNGVKPRLAYWNLIPWFFSAKFLEKKLPMLRQYVKKVSISEKGFQSAIKALHAIDTTNLLPKIQVPTLVLAGKDDILTPPFKGKIVADGILDAQYVILDGGHALSSENPKDFSDQVLSFLQ